MQKEKQEKLLAITEVALTKLERPNGTLNKRPFPLPLTSLEFWSSMEDKRAKLKFVERVKYPIVSWYWENQDPSGGGDNFKKAKKRQNPWNVWVDTQFTDLQVVFPKDTYQCWA